tara:strand:- start:4195 stop:4476 length:282 start_codon:yes stop_codon:yes gene_type:complete
VGAVVTHVCIYFYQYGHNWLPGFDLRHFHHILATSAFEHVTRIEINNSKTPLEAMQSALVKVQKILGHHTSGTTLYYIDPRIIYILSVYNYRT